MFCPRCGNETVIVGALFCSKCGFNLSIVEEKKEPLPQVQSLKPNLPWWKYPAKIILYFFGGFILLGIILVSLMVLSKYVLSETALIIIVVVFAISGLIFVIYKNKRWGWGWYIMSGIIYTSIQKEYTKYGIYQIVIEMCSIVIGLLAYFAFRNKYLLKINTLWQRSFVAGILAMMVAGFFTGFISNLIPTQDNRVAKIIQSQNDILQGHVKSFTEKNNFLWSKFIANPNTTEDFQNNLSIVEAAIPLFRLKDSVLVGTQKDVALKVREIYEETIPSKWSLSFSPSDVDRIVSKAENVRDLDQVMLTNLSSYYQAVLLGKDDYNKYWLAYETTKERIDKEAQEYSRLYKQLGNSNTLNNNK